MDLNKKIIESTKDFTSALSPRTEYEKNLVHFNSTQNIAHRIITYYGEKPTELKEALLEYLREIEKRNYLINSKLESSQLHNKYILPIERFLIKKEQFVTNSDIHITTLLGGIIDLVLFFYLENYWYPMFIVVAFLIGYYRRKQAQKTNRYSKMFW